MFRIALFNQFLIVLCLVAAFQYRDGVKIAKLLSAGTDCLADAKAAFKTQKKLSKKEKKELKRLEKEAAKEPIKIPTVIGEKDLEDNGKPTLILHIGPPKTATTSLQVDLTKLWEELENDGYHYAGRYLNPFRLEGNDHLFINKTYEPIVDHTVDMFTPAWCRKERTRAECIADFKTELDSYLPTGKDIIISDEALCQRYDRAEYYTTLKRIVGKEWNVLLIAGYRYFHQWLQSKQFQKNRMDMHNPWKDAWPALPAPRYKLKGRVAPHIFPDIVRTWAEKEPQFTSNVVELNNGTFPLRVYNLHDRSSSVRTKFMCDMLPHAESACAKSKELDQHPETSMNMKEDIIHTFYDMVVTMAADMGLIDIYRYDRREIRDAMKLYNEEVLHQTYKDFELECPTPAEHEFYLEESLRFERQVFGDEVGAFLEEAHRKDFWDKVKANAYCNVFAEAVLHHQEWRDFFAQFAYEGSAPEPIAG